MTLRLKMILTFSIMMIVALSLFSYHSINTSFKNTYTQNTVRFQNMQATISRALEQEFSMMDLTIEELVNNSSFMSALNQFVRDDSADQKMAYAARNIAQQLLYNSPLVDNFYSVSFFSRDGKFITNFFEKDVYLTSGSEQAQKVINEIPWLDQADAKHGQQIILSGHNDFLSVKRDTQVYSMAVAVYYHGKHIGYIEVSNQYSALQEIMSLTDEDSILVQAVFDNGTLLYSSSGEVFSYPDDLEPNLMVKVEHTSPSFTHYVMHSRIEWLNLNLYIAQDERHFLSTALMLLRSHLNISALIIFPTLMLITLTSSGLTKSIRKLREKVFLLPINDIVHADEAALQQIGQTVTSPYDYEIHDLEQIFDTAIIKLHESALAQTSLQTDTLQARLHALQAQINPHFIYNTLNIISAKSMESGNLEIIEICDQFASMLRYSTDTRSNTATLAEEIENVRNYLQLAKSRYEDNLSFAIDIPTPLNNIVVPKLTLQPLVENAITHGYTGKNEHRHLSIIGHSTADQLVLEIRDNGIGFSPDLLNALNNNLQKIKEGTFTSKDTCGHIGLLGTCLRLHYYSHGNMHISILNDDGAVILISLPHSTAY